jgi:phage tail-like protein
MADAQPKKDDKPAAKLGNTTDPQRNYNFHLNVPGITSASFTECIGLGMRVEPISYREAGAGNVVHMIPGPVRNGLVTLRYGLTDSTDMWKWMQASAQGKVVRVNASIIFVRDDGATEWMRYNLNNAWPCQWSAAPLDALGGEIAIEQMQLAFDSIERA